MWERYKNWLAWWFKAWTNQYAVIIAAVGAVYHYWDSGRTYFEEKTLEVLSYAITVVSYDVSATTTAHSAAIAQYLGMANLFLPIPETIGFALSLSLLWVGCVAYRFVKSWIPTVN